MKKLLSICALLLLGSTLALAQSSEPEPSSRSAVSHQAASKNSSGLTMADRHFIKEAADGGLAEVELGQLAVEKASSDEVKKFGQRMVDDHGKANEQLKQIATSK